ncbi:hypothetical protein IW262DRAFT_1462747 [Armillaria fumosa]|nr:hypothetical protein IW262DRAFT_1462747 [Armillaria fumosa]
MVPSPPHTPCILLTTPPQNVWNIISDNDSLQEGILPALHEYNLAQFIAVDVPRTDHQAVQVNGTKHFLDPCSQTSFAFNHLILEASDPQPADPIQYLSMHFPNSVSSVFSSASLPNQFIIQVIVNKYNPTNYWSS